MSNDSTLSRRHFLQMGGVTLAATTLAACGSAAKSEAEMPAATAEPAVTNADEALQRLMEGNKRYVASKSEPVNESATRRAELAAGQAPFATIFSCVDSRVPPELVFDRGLGDLFVIRTAGQVIDQAVLGSLQFGVAELKIPLLMVMGHENCGAVKATIEAVEGHADVEGGIGWLVQGIRPAVEATEGQEGDHLDNAVRKNVALVVEQLKQSPILAEAIADNTLKIVGARYDLDSGQVEMLTA